MTDDLFDRYKAALRAGHVAVLRGDLEAALAAYRDAEAIAPGRALPHTSMGGVLLDLGRVDEALEELRLALEIAPRDEGALLGRSEALARAGRRGEAAATLDALAEVQSAAGRHGEAADTLQRALSLEERVGRTRRHRAAVRAQRITAGEAAGDPRRLFPLLGAEPGEEPEAPGPVTGADATEVQAVPGGSGSAGGPESDVDAAEPAVAVSPAPTDPRLVGDALMVVAEDAADRGDAGAALASYRAAARVFDDAGLPIAALDACREALAIAPGDVEVHLRYAAIYGSKGWREIAANRLASILRLVDLDGDAEGMALVRTVAAAAYPDDARFGEHPG